MLLYNKRFDKPMQYLHHQKQKTKQEIIIFFQFGSTESPFFEKKLELKE